MEKIEVRGARVHNLRNIDVDVPLNQLVAIVWLARASLVLRSARSMLRAQDGILRRSRLIRAAAFLKPVGRMWTKSNTFRRRSRFTSVLPPRAYVLLLALLLNSLTLYAYFSRVVALINAQTVTM